MIVALFLALFGSEVSYDAEARQRYVAESLAGLAAIEPARRTDISRYVDATAQTRCRSEIYRLRIQCLLLATRRNCRGFRKGEPRTQCELTSDIIITNKLSEDAFLSVATRYEVMKKSNFRQEFTRELRRRYASMTAEMALSGRGRDCGADYQCLAAAIDGYCEENSDASDLSWHRCAAAIVWFMSTKEENGE
ncbi:MAG: hypothetical protein AAFX94_04575 [Myxococcota bacterium]